MKHEHVASTRFYQCAIFVNQQVTSTLSQCSRFFLNVQYSSINKWHQHYLNVQDSQINKWHQQYQCGINNVPSKYHQQCPLKVAYICGINNGAMAINQVAIWQSTTSHKEAISTFKTMNKNSYTLYLLLVYSSTQFSLTQRKICPYLFLEA